MLLEYEAIDHPLLGLLERYKKKIVGFESPVGVLEYFKEGLMKDCLSEENFGSYMNSKSLDQFLN